MDSLPTMSQELLVQQEAREASRCRQGHAEQREAHCDRKRVPGEGSLSILGRKVGTMAFPEGWQSLNYINVPNIEKGIPGVPPPSKGKGKAFS